MRYIRTTRSRNSSGYLPRGSHGHRSSHETHLTSRHPHPHPGQTSDPAVKGRQDQGSGVAWNTSSGSTAELTARRRAVSSPWTCGI